MPPASVTTASSRSETFFPLLQSASHNLREFCQTVSTNLFANLPATMETVSPGKKKKKTHRK